MCSGRIARILTALPVAAALTIGAGCSSPETGTIDGGDMSDEAESYRPPLMFDAATVDTDVEAHLVDGDVLYTLDATDPNGAREDSITTWSIGTGEIVNTAFVGETAADIDEYGNQVPRFGKVDGRVVLAHARVMGGTDAATGEDADALYVSLLDAADGSLIWEVRFDTAAPVEAESSWAGSAGIAIRAVGRHVIVTAAYEEAGSEAWILDAVDGERVGAGLEVIPMLEHDGVVAGPRRDMSDAPAVAAYDLESGAELWAAELGGGRSHRVVDLGEGLLAAYEYRFEYESDRHREAGEHESLIQWTRVFNAADGSELLAVEAEVEGPVACLSDGFGLIGCADEERSYLEVFGLATGESVWSSRRAPVDWHQPNLLGAFSDGVLYMGDSYDGRAMAVDGRTGEYLAEDLPAVFTEVGPGYGLALRDEVFQAPEITVYPASVDRGGRLGVEVTDGPSGVFVESVADGSPADLAGLEVGDLISAVDDIAVTAGEDLVHVIRQYAPGDTVEVTFVRDGENQSVEVVLGG